MIRQIAVLFFIFGVIFNSFSQEKGEFKDPRDGKIYKTIKIGKQLWMAENLAYKPKSGLYWSSKDDTNYVAKYGYLYDWETAQRVCPPGWHLPTKLEFQLLLDYLGGPGENAYMGLIKDSSSGFAPSFGGWLDAKRIFCCFGEEACYWTATLADDVDGFHLKIIKEDKTAKIMDLGFMLGPCCYAIRCVKD